MNRSKYPLLAGFCVLLLLSAFHAGEKIATPAPIGTRACLFLDDRFIDEQSGFERTWHQGKPRAEVAIAEDVSKRPWEKWPHMFGSVLYDPQARIYRMYYESLVWPSRTPPNSFTCHICYAESRDGKTWARPMLGLHKDLDSTRNNIVVPLAEFAKVFIDPLEKDPAARLKMFAYLQPIRAKEGAAIYPKGTRSPDGSQIWPMGGAGECLLSSADGINWKFVEGYNSPGWANEKYAPAKNFTDCRTFLFDPLKQRYMAYVRTMAKSHVAESKMDFKRRAIGITHSAQINRGWAPVEHVLEADARDDEKVARLSKDPKKPDFAELYTMSLFPYGNHYLGMLSLIYLIDDYDANGGGDLQFTYSHDGYQWSRPVERQTMIAPSNAAPELFPTYVSNNGPLEIGDELWLYYTETNGAHALAPSVGVARSQIRAAVWRKDGFVSLDAAQKASLTTKPLTFTGKELRVNFDTRAGGALRVAILDDKGKALPGFGLEDCVRLTGDAVSRPVLWKSRADLSALKDRPIRLRFELVRGRLWSFLVAAESTPVRIVCLGDSVTRAANVKAQEQFCAVLESRLRSDGRQATVINSGVGSDTTELGLKRFERDVLAHRPTHVFLMFGLNDAYRAKDQKPLVPLDRYSQNLREMVAALRRRQIVPILMTSNPHAAGGPENVELKPYIEACREVAGSERVLLVDVYAHFAELAVEGNRGQRLYAASPHLNPDGNRVIAELMAKSLHSPIPPDH